MWMQPPGWLRRSGSCQAEVRHAAGAVEAVGAVEAAAGAVEVAAGAVQAARAVKAAAKAVEAAAGAVEAALSLHNEAAVPHAGPDDSACFVSDEAATSGSPRLPPPSRFRRGILIGGPDTSRGSYQGPTTNRRGNSSRCISFINI